MFIVAPMLGALLPWLELDDQGGLVIALASHLPVKHQLGLRYISRTMAPNEPCSDNQGVGSALFQLRSHG